MNPADIPVILASIGKAAEMLESLIKQISIIIEKYSNENLTEFAPCMKQGCDGSGPIVTIYENGEKKKKIYCNICNYPIREKV
jgi:biotin-(acetyl-CoA carboxylase) ligase